MRIAAAALGMVIGVSCAVGITVSQAETKMIHGQAHLVVPTVSRRHAHDTPIVRRCLWVGVPAGLLGAGIGYLATSGVNLGAAFVGAMILSALSASTRDNWPERFGRAGENTQVSDMFLHALLGGLLGAVAAVYWCKHKERLPERLQPPESADVG
jgi:hypothetical protein